MPYEPKPLPFQKSALRGISERTIDVHYEKLYKGYVTKYNETQQKINSADQASANQVFSDWRGVKSGETFALDAIILHELYFENLGGNGDWQDTAISNLATDQFGSMEEFISQITATAMSARGWAVAAINPLDLTLSIFAQDSHDHGAIWVAKPVLILDVYEHAYFIDFGSDRKSYIETFWQNVNWESVDRRLI